MIIGGGPGGSCAAVLNAVLAGELEGGWRMRWRMRLFFWLVRVQARFPVVPRISFDPVPSV